MLKILKIDFYRKEFKISCEDENKKTITFEGIEEIIEKFLNNEIDTTKIEDKGYVSKKLINDFINYFKNKSEEELKNFKNDHNIINLHSQMFYFKGNEFDGYDSVESFINKKHKTLSEDYKNSEDYKRVHKLDFKKSDNTFYIDFSSRRNSELFIREYGNKLKKTVYYHELDKKSFDIKNKSAIYFYMNRLKDFNYNLDNLEGEDLDFFKQLKNMEESFKDLEVTDDPYINNVNGYIERNNGKAVIADSVSKKEEAVSEYIKNNSKKVLIIGKPESLEKYKKYNIKNRVYVKNTVFSSKKDILTIKSQGNDIYKVKDNRIHINDVNAENLIEGEVQELTVANNGTIQYILKNPPEGKEGPQTLKQNLMAKSIVTAKSKEIMEQCEGIDSFIFSDAEKIKDSKSSINLSFTGVVEELDPKNRIFVSSNPIYNSIKEIEPILSMLDKDLLEEIKMTLEDITSRSLKTEKDSFLLQVVRKYILKREKEELSILIKEEDNNQIKETKFINKRMGILKEETEYYNEIKRNLNKYLDTIIKVTLKRVERGKDLKNVDYKEQNLDYYMQDYEKFRAVKGEVINQKRLMDMSKILQSENIVENEVGRINSYSYSKATFSEKFIMENKSKLSIENQKKIEEIIENSKDYLMDKLFERVLKTPFTRIREYDIKNSELIDGKHIAKRHLSDIKEYLEESEVPNKTKNIIFENNSLVHGNKIENYTDSINSKLKKLKSFFDHHSYYKNKLTDLGYDVPADNPKEYIKNELKKLKDTREKIMFAIEGEKLVFYKELEKQLNLKEIHKKMAELKLKNTKRVVEDLVSKKENVMVCSMYNGTINTLSKSFPNAIVVKNKSDLENLKLNKDESNIVLTTYNKIGENVENKFEGSLLYNDMPWNKATSEKVENSLNQKNINVYINSMEENILDNLFVNRVNAKSENIKNIMNGVEDYKQVSDKDFKELMIKEVFRKCMNDINESRFEDIKKMIENEEIIKETMKELNSTLNIMF